MKQVQKKCYVIILYIINSSIIILFTKNFKQLFFALMLVKKTKVLCCFWVSNRYLPPNKMRIKPWYVQIQQNRVIFLQVYVNLFEYWLLSKFSHLTARQNKSRPGGEIFRIWTRGNNIFSRLSGKTTRKLFSYEQPLNYNEYICLNKVIHQIDRKWTVFPFTEFYG